MKIDCIKDMRFSRVLLRSPRMIKISPMIGIWTTFSSHVVSSVIGGILSVEARDMDTKLLSTPESNNTLTRFPSQMTHLVASITLDSARSCVMQCAFLTQRTVSSIPTVLSWGGSIRPEGFRPSILLLTVIIVTVAIVVAVVLNHALLSDPSASGNRPWKLLKEEEKAACLTTKFNYFPKVQVKDLVLFQRFPISQRTIRAEKQAGNVQTSLTLSSGKVKIQSMMDVLIHQEDPAVQRTPLIDIVISMVTDKIMFDFWVEIEF
nr:hypothetical protein [Tanacetum cinerariifolium]